MPREELPEDWREIAIALGQRIRTFREVHGLTQEQLAHRAGLSRNQVQNIESARNNSGGLGNPKLSTLVALARIFQVPVGHLLPDRINDGVNGPWPPPPPEQAQPPA